jgi:hypothetical protein
MGRLPSSQSCGWVNAPNVSSSIISLALSPMCAATRLQARSALFLGMVNLSPAWASCSAMPRPGVGLRQPDYFMPVFHLRFMWRQKKSVHQIGVALLTAIRGRGIYQVFRLIRSALRPLGLGAFLLPLIHLVFSCFDERNAS